MSDELDTLEIEVSAQLLEKTEAYMDLAGWDANEIVTHALTTLFKVAESRNFPPTIPDACLALGKLIRAGRREGSDDEGSSASTDRLGKERQKGKTFQPFSTGEVDQALSKMIPGASSWMVEKEKNKDGAEASEGLEDPPTP